ncbi:MAG: 2'-5' RNA ligase family protein [Chloroflexota bacterium]|nr:2'-5' RNA ligase family protein [Chloroflexota bacterium]
MDKLRLRWDPQQAMTVESHVTVIDELVDLERLIAVAASTPPLRLRISRSARWIAPDPGLFLVVDDPQSDLRRFREVLLGPESATYRPHVTLLHRDSIGSQAQLDEAWASLGDIDLDQDFIARELTVHDLVDGVWREVARPRFLT